MKYAKILGLAAIAAMAIMAFVGASSASATVLCKTTLVEGCAAAKWDYPAGTEIHAVLVENTEAKLENLSGSTIYAHCSESTLQGTTANTGSSTETVSGSGVVTWGAKNVGCSTTVDTLENGTLEVHYGEKGDGVVTGKGVVVTVELFGVTCAYGTAATGTKLGTLTEPASSTADTVIDANAEVEKKSGGFLCPSETRWTAEYTITSPVPLYVSTN
jgi:hypothetical protein